MLASIGSNGRSAYLPQVIYGVGNAPITAKRTQVFDSILRRVSVNPGLILRIAEEQYNSCPSVGAVEQFARLAWLVTYKNGS